MPIKASTASNVPLSAPLNYTKIAEALKRGIDANQDVQTEGRVRALARMEPSDRAEILKELDKLVAKEDSKKYYDALERLGNKAGFVGMFVQAQALQPGQGAAAKADAPEGSDKGVDLRAKVSATGKKAGPAPVSTEPMLDAVDDVAKKLEASNAEIRAAAAKLPKNLQKELEKLLASSSATIDDKLRPAAGKLEVVLDKLSGAINKELDKTDASLERVKQLQAVRDLIIDKFLPALKPKTETATATPTTPATPAPTATTTAAPVAPPAGIPEPTTQLLKQMEKATGQIKEFSRSARIMALIDSGAPIEHILMAVMLLLFEDSDDKLKQKLKEQAEKQKAIEDLRMKEAALEHGDPMALQQVAKEQTEQQVGKAAAETLNEVHEVTSKDGKEQAEEKKKQVEKGGGEASRGEIEATPEARLDKAKNEGTKEKAKEADQTTEAESKAAKADPAKPAADTADAPQADAGPANPALDAALRSKELAEVRAQLKNSEGSITQFNFEVQNLVENRKQMLELVSKLLNEISNMISTIIRNI